MNGSPLRFAGVELYFHDLDRARAFYREVLGLNVADEESGHYTRFDSGAGFVCLERKGSEQYSSRDKAVLFFEVEDLEAARQAIGPDRFVHVAAGWAVLHDPEGHNVLLLERKSEPMESIDAER
jgi:predicted enzyme related to lactoylglutathione lyase